MSLITIVLNFIVRTTFLFEEISNESVSTTGGVIVPLKSKTLNLIASFEKYQLPHFERKVSIQMFYENVLQESTEVNSLMWIWIVQILYCNTTHCHFVIILGSNKTIMTYILQFLNCLLLLSMLKNKRRLVLVCYINMLVILIC